MGGRLDGLWSWIDLRLICLHREIKSSDTAVDRVQTVTRDVRDRLVRRRRSRPRCGPGGHEFRASPCQPRREREALPAASPIAFDRRSKLRTITPSMHSSSASPAPRLPRPRWSFSGGRQLGDGGAQPEGNARRNRLPAAASREVVVSEVEASQGRRGCRARGKRNQARCLRDRGGRRVGGMEEVRRWAPTRRLSGGARVASPSSAAGVIRRRNPAPDSPMSFADRSRWQTRERGSSGRSSPSPTRRPLRTWSRRAQAQNPGRSRAVSCGARRARVRDAAAHRAEGRRA